MPASPMPFLSAEEYLAIERKAEFKSEYFQGKMYLMAGGTADHALIIGNLSRAAGNALDGQRCFVYPAELRVVVSPSGLYTYPDVMIVCGDPAYTDGHKDTIANPVVIFEVLSKSTEAYDRGEKFALYRGLTSLREYVLVSPAKAQVERYWRQADGNWSYSSIGGIDGVLRLESLHCEIPLSAVYKLVEFRPEEQAAPQQSRLE